MSIGSKPADTYPDINGDRPYIPTNKWPCGCSETHAHGEVVWFVCEKHLAPQKEGDRD